MDAPWKNASRWNVPSVPEHGILVALDVTVLKLQCACQSHFTDVSASPCALQEAVRLRANYADSYTAMGVSLKELGRKQEAQACFQVVARLRPSCALSLGNLAGIYYEQVPRSLGPPSPPSLPAEVLDWGSVRLVGVQAPDWRVGCLWLEGNTPHYDVLEILHWQVTCPVLVTHWLQSAVCFRHWFD